MRFVSRHETLRDRLEIDAIRLPSGRHDSSWANEAPTFRYGPHAETIRHDEIRELRFVQLAFHLTLFDHCNIDGRNVHQPVGQSGGVRQGSVDRLSKVGPKRVVALLGNQWLFCQDTFDYDE